MNKNIEIAICVNFHTQFELNLFGRIQVLQGERSDVRFLTPFPAVEVNVDSTFFWLCCTENKAFPLLCLVGQNWEECTVGKFDSDFRHRVSFD